MSDMFDQKWDIRFLQLAHEVATWSKDPSVQVGAVIIDHERKPVSFGYNGFPSGIPDDDTSLENDEVRRDLMVHAEMNAILQAERYKLKGSTLFVWPMFPCPRCAVNILASGIKRVITTDYEPDRWIEPFKKSKNIFGQHDPDIGYIQYPYNET